MAPLVPEAVERGGHVRVGLEDAPLGSGRTNVELVEDARGRIADAGATLATADEVRREVSAANTGV
ncbi:3-keto-5-aminohexanoate cleavage protein [Halomarina ordinaria]|uniref:3-keto-5-aminohexanoate cleavage protein n=1 Tax=Halomarina ordinaria TaxID=3033939 RepID=A0ABD5UFL9_9EURY